MQSSGVSKDLEVVGSFDAWPSGIAVSRSGRMFVSLPRVAQPVSTATLVELRDGKPHPFPDELVNDPAAADATHRFTSIHGIRMAPGNRLFALDTGATSFDGCDPAAAALYCIDLDHNAIVRRYSFAEGVVRKTSYLNDLVVEYARGTAGTAYITDSGSHGPNAIVVLDLDSGRSLRRLSGHLSVRGKSGNDGFAIRVHGETLAMPGAVGADGIALSPDGKTLWWTPLSSYDFHCIATDVLADFTKPDVEAVRAVQTLPEREFASDGLDCDREGRVYFTDITNGAIQRYIPAQQRFERIAHDARLVWPDAVSLGPDRILYVTASQLNRAPSFNGGTDLREKPFALYRMANDADPAGY